MTNPEIKLNTVPEDLQELQHAVDLILSLRSSAARRILSHLYKFPDKSFCFTELQRELKMDRSILNANLINLNKKGLIECNKNRTRREIKIADHPLQDLIKEKIDSEILEQRRESAAEIERLQLNAAIMMRLRLSGDKYETTDSESGS